MSTEWFVERKTGVSGPYTAAKLKALAEQGRVSPTDFIRRGIDGTAVPASRVKGLFDRVSEPTQPSPPLPPPVARNVASQSPPRPMPQEPEIRLNSAEIPSETLPDAVSIQTEDTTLKRVIEKATTVATRLRTDTKAAAQLAAKQAERAKINQLTLPNAYGVLGKAIYAAQKYQNEFADIYAEIDEGHQRVKALKEVNPAPSTRTLSEGAKSAAARLRDSVAAKALAAKVAIQLRALGEAAYKTDGQLSGPADLTSAIADLQKRVAQLDADIAQIEQPYAGRAFTPKRIAIGGASALGVCLVLALLLWTKSDPKSQVLGKWLSEDDSNGAIEVLSEGRLTLLNLDKPDSPLSGQYRWNSDTEVDVMVPIFGQVICDVSVNGDAMIVQPKIVPLNDRLRKDFNNTSVTNAAYKELKFRRVREFPAATGSDKGRPNRQSTSASTPSSVAGVADTNGRRIDSETASHATPVHVTQEFFPCHKGLSLDYMQKFFLNERTLLHSRLHHLDNQKLEIAYLATRQPHENRWSPTSLGIAPGLPRGVRRRDDNLVELLLDSPWSSAIEWLPVLRIGAQKGDEWTQRSSQGGQADDVYRYAYTRHFVLRDLLVDDKDTIATVQEIGVREDTLTGHGRSFRRATGSNEGLFTRDYYYWVQTYIFSATRGLIVRDVWRSHALVHHKPRLDVLAQMDHVYTLLDVDTGFDRKAMTVEATIGDDFTGTCLLRYGEGSDAFGAYSRRLYSIGKE